MTGRSQVLLIKNGQPVEAYTVAKLRDPMEPIDSYFEEFDEFKHLVTLYDDRKLAKRVEFRHIKNGLLKREQCQYVIPQDDPETPDSIRKQMDAFGIDTEHYMSDD